MKRFIKFCIFIIFIMASIFLLSKDYLFFDVKRDVQSTSPNGSKTITLRYDYVSRPHVFYGDEAIFHYESTGFNETVFFEIEWISENEIRLFSEEFDEEYFILLE